MSLPCPCVGAIIVRPIAAAMKPWGGKMLVLTRPRLPARCGWRPIPLPTIPDEIPGVPDIDRLQQAQRAHRGADWLVRTDAAPNVGRHWGGHRPGNSAEGARAGRTGTREGWRKPRRHCREPPGPCGVHSRWSGIAGEDRISNHTGSVTSPRPHEALAGSESTQGLNTRARSCS
jgi:hypothetical protein